jgi:nascent polypeptide-associated complex subunit alpha
VFLKAKMAPGMGFDNRQTRRMMDRMGIKLDQIEGVEEVIIRTAEKDIVIKGAQVSEINAKGAGGRMYQVIGEDVEERMREKPKYTRDDVLLVAQQSNTNEARAEQALKDTDGDIAQAILRLTT